MLLILLIWAYANRVTSSRQIEARCWSDVAFRVICAGDVPDHTVIARFRSRLGTAAAQSLFAEVLKCCARLGMGQVGVITVDGTKVAASASKAANREEEALRRIAAELAAGHAANDAAEDDRFGPGGRGDQVPAGAARPRSAAAAAERARRIQEALAELEAAREAARQVARDAERAEQDRAEAFWAAGGKGRPPVGARVAVARQGLGKAIADREAQLAHLADRAAGSPDKRRAPRVGVHDHNRVRAARDRLARAQAQQNARADRAATRAAGQVRSANMTDPQSRLMRVRGGWLQGYNPQNVTSTDKLIIATRLTSDPVDMAWFGPMISDAVKAAILIAAHRPAPPPGTTPAPGADPGPAHGGIGQVLADAGYLSAANLQATGPDRLIATGRHRGLEKTAREGPATARPWDSGVIAGMAARLATPEGIKAYRQRGHIAETPHAQIKHNLGFRQFTMRGKDKATTEWTLVCTTHNLMKAITTGHLTPQALTTL